MTTSERDAAELPSPAGVSKALAAAVAAIYFADSSDYRSALWSVVEALDPALAELLEDDEQAAFYVTHEEDDDLSDLSESTVAAIKAFRARAAAPPESTP